MKPPSRRRFPFREEVRPLKDDEEIGHRWKRSNACSLVILIGRGLDLREAREKKLRLERKQEGRKEG